MRLRLAILLAVLGVASLFLNGCATSTMADLLKQENSSGCLSGWISGSHLGMAGNLRVLAMWGSTPPDPAACVAVPQP